MSEQLIVLIVFVLFAAFLAWLGLREKKKKAEIIRDVTYARWNMKETPCYYIPIDMKVEKIVAITCLIDDNTSTVYNLEDDGTIVATKGMVQLNRNPDGLFDSDSFTWAKVTLIIYYGK